MRCLAELEQQNINLPTEVMADSIWSSIVDVYSMVCRIDVLTMLDFINSS